MTVFQDNIRLSSDIFNFLQKNLSGEVLLTTSKGIYLQFSSQIITLTDHAYGVTPIGCGLDHFVDFLTVIKPQANQQVQLHEGRFHFPGGILEPHWDIVEPLVNPLRVLFDSVTLCARQLKERSQNSRGVASLVAPLLLSEPLCSNAQANPYCTLALPVLTELTESEICNIDESVGRLLGLGLGLTPSLDDVLLGLLYGLIRYDPHGPRTAAVKDAILKYAPSKTHAISAAYLNAVALGGPFERLDGIMSGLSGTITLDITPILQIGSSSGSEMLLGLLLAAKMTMKG